MSMQKTLTNMGTWAQHNNIRFNAFKCNALTITRKKSTLNFIYKLDNVELERLSTEKDVGGTSPTPSPGTHISKPFLPRPTSYLDF